MAEAILDTAAPVTRDENAVDLGCTVSVESFSGPLDLLLFLVRKSELDIIDIPIATIADQFVMLVASWQQEEQLDLEMAGDFILMAATLLEIKARTIAPPPVTDGEQADAEADDLLDPRADLIGKLLAYRRFKEAVGLLMQAETARSQLVLRQTREDIPEDPDEAAGIDLGELQVSELSKYWYTLLARIGGAGPRTVMKDDLPIEGSIRKLSERAEAEQQLTLQQLFAGEPTLQGRVSMLMATLECTRQRIVRTAQLEQYGEIAMQFRPVADRIIVPVEFPPEEGGKKRRRRPPLVTFTAPVAPSADEQEDVPDVEEKHETDEERFLRELNEACDLDGVLARVHDVEKGFQQYWEVLHPAPPPVVVAVPDIPVVVPAPVLDVVVSAEAPAAVLVVPVIQPAVATVALGAVVESPVVAEIQPSAEVQKLAEVQPLVETTLLVEPLPTVISQEDLASTPAPQASDLAVTVPQEVQASSVGVPETTGCVVESTTSPVVAEPVVQAEHAAALPEQALASEPQAELTSEPVHDALSMAPAVAAQENALEPVDAVTEPVPLVLSVAPLVRVAVDEPQISERTDPTADVVDSEVDPAPIPGTAPDISNPVDSLPSREIEETPYAVAEPEVEAAVPSFSSELEVRVETVEAVFATPELEPEHLPDVETQASGTALGASSPAEAAGMSASTLPPEPGAPAATPPAVTAEMVAVSAVEVPEVVAPASEALVVEAPAAVAEVSQQPVTVPIITPEPVFEQVAVANSDAPEVTAPLITEPVAAEASQSAPAPVEAPVAEPEAAVSASIAQARPPSSASSPGFRSRTLLLLLAGTAGAACAVWWSLRSASVEPELAAVTAVPGTVAVFAPEADAGALVTTPTPDEAHVDPATLATSTSQPVLAPASQAGLSNVQTEPSQALIEHFTGGPEQWFDRQSLPIAVPWYACTELPVLPAGPAAFTSEPRFDDVPVLAWARPEAWAWCLQVRAVQPSEPFMPASAFIPELSHPDALMLWAQPSSLAGVPVATFAQDLGWTVLVRPAPVPLLEIWVGRR